MSRIQKCAICFSSMMCCSTLLISCNKDPMPSPEVAEANKSRDTIQEILGYEFIPMETCADAMKRIEATHPGKKAVFLPASYEYALVITETNPADLKDKFKKRDVKDTNIDPNKPESWPDALESDKVTKTKWDFEADLSEKPIESDETVSYQTATIKIVLRPPTQDAFRFVPEEYVLRAGDKAGVRMFCGPTVSGDTAYMTLYYHPETDKYYGSYNLGLIVKDKKTGHETPVFYDPEVKNDG